MTTEETITFKGVRLPAAVLDAMERRALALWPARDPGNLLKQDYMRLITGASARSLALELNKIFPESDGLWDEYMTALELYHEKTK